MYMLISMPTGTSTIFGAFQAICSPLIRMDSFKGGSTCSLVEFLPGTSLLGAKRSPLYSVAGTMAPRLTTMDRIYLAIIASAILLVLGVAGPVVIRTADLMPHARPVSAAQLR